MKNCSKKTENNKTDGDSYKKTSLKTNLFLNVVYEILVIAMPLCTAPYVSRIFDSDGIGIYSYTQSLVSYFVLFATLGTSLYGVKQIASVRDDKNEYSKSFWGIEAVIIISSSICLAIWFVFAFLYKRYSSYMLALSFTVLACMFDISWFYKGLEKFKYNVLINIIVKIGVLILVFTIIKTKNDLWKYIFISSLGVLLGNISMWLFLPKFLCKTKVGIKELGTHFKETLVYFAPSIATTVYTVLDKTLIGVITQDDNQNGYYEQATKIINICKSICFIGFTGVMTSRMSYYYSANNKAGINKGVIATLNITLFLSLGACFGLVGVASRFVPLYFGDGFGQTITILYILSPIIPIICVSSVLGALVYTPSGQIKKATIFLVIGSAVNLCLNIPLIILFKSYGAAVASICAETIISILFLIFARDIFSLSSFLKIIWKKIIAGSIMLIAILLANHFLSRFFDVIPFLALEIMCGFILYTVILFVLRDDAIKMASTFLFKRKNLTTEENLKQ